MKCCTLVVAIGLLSASLAPAGPKVRWPKDAVEWEKLEEARKTAVDEEQGLAFIFVPSEWKDEDDPGVVRSIEATNDAISAVKSFCLVVKGNMQAVARPAEGSTVPKALVEGFGQAGNSYPLVVVLDGAMTTVLAATSGQAIFEGEGRKIFREAKKKQRELLEEGGEKE